MRIGEVVKRTGLSKKAVQHYVAEGIVTPAAEDNGYLDFSDEDVTTLLTVRRLRELDFPLATIRAMLATPQSVHYHVAAHRRRLHEEQWRLERQLSATDALLSGLAAGDGSEEALGSALKAAVPDDLFPTDKDRALTWEDAETLALFLMGHFVDASSLSMYQQFLCDRLKQVILTCQDEAALALRDLLHETGPKRLEPFGFSPRGDYERAGFASEQECRGHLGDIVHALETGLRNPRLRRLCQDPYNRELNEGCGRLLMNREICAILEGLSPYFAALWRSYRFLETTLGEYVETPTGMHLAQQAGAMLGKEMASSSDLAFLYPLFASAEPR